LDIKWSEHIKTAIEPKDYPNSEIPEIAMTGRSNVGKSSVVNFLAGRKNLARVGNTPGKTRQINFYSLEGKIILVDLPGYGYAQVSKSEKAKWGKIIETYLNGRKQLKMILMLVDIRHKPTFDDKLMYEWICSKGIPHTVVATKADKIGRNHYSERIRDIKETLNMIPGTPVIPVSITKKTGFTELWNELKREFPFLEAES